MDQLLSLRERLLSDARELIRSYEGEIAALERRFGITSPPQLFEGVVALVVTGIPRIQTLVALEEALLATDGVAQAFVRHYDRGEAWFEITLVQPVALTAELAELLPMPFAVRSTTANEIELKRQAASRPLRPAGAQYTTEPAQRLHNEVAGRAVQCDRGLEVRPRARGERRERMPARSSTNTPAGHLGGSVPAGENAHHPVPWMRDPDAGPSDRMTRPVEAVRPVREDPYRKAAVEDLLSGGGVFRELPGVPPSDEHIPVGQDLGAAGAQGQQRW
jgi:hypothetical protein